MGLVELHHRTESFRGWYPLPSQEISHLITLFTTVCHWAWWWDRWM